ncbi:DUF1835 domain-containing protein [Sporolactobacillus sp. THM7-7]|nr:DUF1835 domain-containing protein [Sporolactobacillus sp. THM7-7]
MIRHMKRAIKSLTEEESKTLLLQIFHRVNMLDETAYSEKELIKDLHGMADEILCSLPVFNQSEEKQKEVHIIFGDSASGSLKFGLNQFGLTGHKKQVITFPDALSIGPVWKMDQPKGLKQRGAWMERHQMIFDEDASEYENQLSEACSAIRSIPEELPIIIWTGNNANEQTGLRLALSLLKGKTNEIRIINTSSFFSSDHAPVTPISTGEIQPETLMTIYKKNRNAALLTMEGRNTFENQWKELAATKEVLRIWEDEKVRSVPEDYFDALILKAAKHLQHKDRMLCMRLIGEVIGEIRDTQSIDDFYIEYRIRQLTRNGVLEIVSVPDKLRFCYLSVRSKNETVIKDFHTRAE